MPRQKIKLGELLTGAGRITEFQLDSALSHQKMVGGRLGASLIKLGYIRERELIGFLGEQLGLPLVDLAKEPVDAHALALLPRQKAVELNVLPLKQHILHGVNCLVVAMSDPTNLHLIDSLRFMIGQRILPALAAEEDIRAAIDIFYGVSREGNPAAAQRTADPVSAPINEERFRELQTTEAKYQALLKLLLTKGILTPREYDRLL